jgi:hypothetical protein
MRFQLQSDSWTLDVLTPTEWDLITELPALAAGETVSEKTRDRLFPSPISPEVLVDEDMATQAEDWDEFVRPDLEDSFSQDRDVVAESLQKVELVDVTEFLSPEQIEEWSGEFPQLRRVTVPKEHTDSWYSALNQARILMNEEYEVAESEDRLLLYAGSPGDPADLDQDRIMMLAQYELFSAIQVMLVDRVMAP